MSVFTDALNSAANRANLIKEEPVTVLAKLVRVNDRLTLIATGDRLKASDQPSVMGKIDSLSHEYFNGECFDNPNVYLHRELNFLKRFITAHKNEIAKAAEYRKEDSDGFSRRIARFDLRVQEVVEFLTQQPLSVK